VGKQTESRKPTFKDLLERHNIPYEEFYLNCMNVPTEDIRILYENNLCAITFLERMLRCLNLMADQNYTAEDVYVAHAYGLSQ
jgi:predicted nuclease of predicted toxin-antitoxin system